ncbi:hypothetical protein pipiens_019526 [Culex pipiens pipiens]|uniref:Uncharacterized protein n=1 Tax=Culex pipiens pipiens TaxID=38569 RepID=A0ABD1DUB3_CULPP
MSPSMYCGSEGAGESSGSPPSSSDGPPSSGPMNDNRDNRGIRNNSVGGGRYNSMLPNVSGGSGNDATRFAGCGIEPGVSLKMVQEQLVATESVLRELGFQVLKTKMPKATLAIRRKAPSTTQAGGGGQNLHRN